MTTALPNKDHNEYRKATDEDDDQGIYIVLRDLEKKRGW